MKIYYDDLTLAYKTLVNDKNRQEYDDFLDDYYAVSGHHRRNKGLDFDEDDPEVIEERERRQRERGKKRFEQDYDFVNQEFFSYWKNRTGSQTNQDIAYDGSDLHQSISITFEESVSK